VPETFTVTFNVEDEDGIAINNAVISFAGITNAPGNYVFNDILEGSYSYSVVADGFQTIAVEAVTITDDAVINVVMTRLTYTVTFHIKDPGGVLITTAVVTFNQQQNSAGNYVFENVLPGSYNYSVQADGFHPVAVEAFQGHRRHPCSGCYGSGYLYRNLYG
jgi:hypothetical protein